MEAHYLIYKAPPPISIQSWRLTDVELIECAKKAIKIVTEYSFSEYNVASRKREIILCRQMFMVLVKRHTSYGLEKIGSLFFRYVINRKTKDFELMHFDHSSVIHSMKVIATIEDVKDKDGRYQTWSNVKKRFNALTRPSYKKRFKEFD
jgi:chromosomal replication initiation ATPase DnaA